MLQIVGLTLIVIFIGCAVFYFFGSAATLDKEDYKRQVEYEAPNQSFQGGDTLRVITYNIGYLSGMSNNRSVERKPDIFDDNLHASKVLMSRYQPDLVGFQEIDFEAERSFFVNQADELGYSMPFYKGFHSVNWDKRYVPFPFGALSNHFGKMVSGQSILSRYDLKNPDHIVLSKPQNSPFYYNAFYLDRLIQTCDWIVGDKVVKVMNLHLEAFDKETRSLQAERVKEEYLRFYEEFPVLIMGDFNSLADWMKKDAMQLIMDAPEITSAIDRNQYTTDSLACFTFSSEKPSYMIDYILYNQSFIEKVEAKVLTEAGQISDHLPVLFDFKFKQ